MHTFPRLYMNNTTTKWANFHYVSVFFSVTFSSSTTIILIQMLIYI